MTGPVYIVCGGTGGHLAPGIATAQRFIEKGVRVQLIISQKEIDSRLLKAYPEIPYRRARGSPFGWHPARLVPFVLNSCLGLLHSINLMRSHRPVAVIAFGGYLSFSYVLAAWLLRIPVILHEANRRVGKSIRTLSHMADRLYLPTGVALSGVKPSRIRRSGMPLRREVRHIPKEEIRHLLGVPMHAKVLVVVGGSQGAVALNEWVGNHYRKLAREGIWIYLVAGPGKNTLPDKEVLESSKGQPVEIRTFPFHASLHELFSCSDLVISRAGAGTIAELIHCLTPSILIPYPHAADQHQLANARDLEKRGGCIVMEQSDMHGLYREVTELIYNDSLLAKLRKNLRRLDSDDVAELIVLDVLQHFAGEQAHAEERMELG